MYCTHFPTASFMNVSMNVYKERITSSVHENQHEMGFILPYFCIKAIRHLTPKLLCKMYL
jgi:hypothetical protein